MTQALVDVERSVGLALKRATAALRTAMDEALQPFAVSVTQYACLEQLRQRPRLSAAELARATFVTRQSAHATLAGLQERGLLRRSAQAPPGRALPVELTESGLELLEGASAAVAAVEARMLDALDGAEVARLHAGLVSCAAALEHAPEAQPVAPGASAQASRPAVAAAEVSSRRVTVR